MDTWSPPPKCSLVSEPGRVPAGHHAAVDEVWAGEANDAGVASPGDPAGLRVRVWQVACKLMLALLEELILEARPKSHLLFVVC